MSVGIVAFIPNEKNRTQEELIRKFGCVEMDYGKGEKEIIPTWKVFEWVGRSYASWYLSPRYVEPERYNPRWEGIRQRLVEVMEYLGAKEVRYSIHGGVLKVLKMKKLLDLIEFARAEVNKEEIRTIVQFKEKKIKDRK